MTERAYASTVCPYCSAPLDPLPKAKKRCPTCAQPIHVRSGPDELRYLLREIDLDAHEQRWTEYLDRRWWIERAADFADEQTFVATQAVQQGKDPRYTIRDAYWAVANRGAGGGMSCPTPTSRWR